MKRPWLLIALLFGFWIALTESLAPAELALGLAAALIVGLGTWRLLGEESHPLLIRPRQAWRFLLYVPYLLKEIVVANIYVAEKVLDPRLPISPVIAECHYPFSQDVAVVGLANSITLTPGTLTVDVDGDTFYVHCLAKEFAETMPEGDLYRHIRHVFEED